jgi:phosphopantothenoylcysteine decarboxylase/phosphopantothenate--cysteine ligase
MAGRNENITEMNPPHGWRIKVVLGVSGGIAAYKAVDLASKMTAAGAQVRTVMTENALRLVGAKSFEAVTGEPVYTSMWEETQEYKTRLGEGDGNAVTTTGTPSRSRVGHISLADWADVVVVAPATANIIGKFANGICDDLLSTVLCASWAKPLVFVPAMNEKMWNNPAVQQNIKLIRRIGVKLIGPERGRLACGMEGVGRMAEPQDILGAIGETVRLADRKHKHK